MDNVFLDADVREKAKEIYKYIQEVYLLDPRPWVIGYSGGKDSTLITQLIFSAIQGLEKEKRFKQIYVISSDTLVENPMIVNYINYNLQMIQQAAERLELPITTHKVKPEIEQTYWVNLIGRGYPAPQQSFRWCTDRMKIVPANKFILECVSKYGEAVVVLGVRRQESSSRSKVIERHKVDGKVLARHSTLKNAYIFSPIEDFSTDDVWKYLNVVNPSPYGTDNGELIQLYQDSMDGECPLVIDKTTKSCGNSRFGCWVCTVVKEDKSLLGFIKSGDQETRDKLIPLLKFRNWLKDNRNSSIYRDTKRQNGSIYKVNTADGEKQGYGPYNFYGRQEILRRLLQAQQEVGIELICKEELQIIQNIWKERIGDFENKVYKIYHEITGLELAGKFDERPAMESESSDRLLSLCEQEGVSCELVNKLLSYEAKYYGLKYRTGIYKGIDNIMNQQWLHQDIVGDLEYTDHKY